MFSSSRRQFLKLISLSITGTIVVGSIPFIGNFFVSKAQAKVVSEKVYKNRKYKVVTKDVDNTPKKIVNGSQTIETPYDAPVELYIDDQQVDLIRDKKTKKYSTYILPFTDYDSPGKLAEELIELGVEVPKGKPLLNFNVDQ